MQKFEFVELNSFRYFVLFVIMFFPMLCNVPLGFGNGLTTRMIDIKMYCSLAFFLKMLTCVKHEVL